MQHESFAVAADKPPLQLFATRFSEEQSKLSSYQKTLSPLELEKVSSKATDLLRHHAILSYGLRRKVLADLLRVDPASLQFEFTAHTKPILFEHALHFNVSHSGDYWVLCAHPTFPVGIDIEIEERKIDFLAIAERFFHSEEVIEIKKHPEIFWRYWTAKEAILKATGEGIVYGLDRIKLTLDQEDELNCEDWELIFRKAFPGTLLTIAIGEVRP